MKNLIGLFGIIVLVAVMGFSMVACDGDSKNGDNSSTIPAELIGTWVTKLNPSEFGFKIENGKFFNTENSTGYPMSVSGKTITVEGLGKMDYFIYSDGDLYFENATDDLQSFDNGLLYKKIL